MASQPDFFVSKFTLLVLALEIQLTRSNSNCRSGLNRVLDGIETHLDNLDVFIGLSLFYTVHLLVPLNIIRPCSVEVCLRIRKTSCDVLIFWPHPTWTPWNSTEISQANCFFFSC